MKTFNGMLCFVIIVAVGCTNSSDPIENDPDPPDYIVINEDFASGVRVEVCAEDSVKIGYTNLFIALFDSASNSKLEDVTISVEPVMHMAMHSHSAPNAGVGKQLLNGYWPCPIVFIMAGDWELHIQFTNNANQQTGNIVLPISVSPSGLVKKVTGADSMSYFITMIEPRDPEVGLNTFEIAIHIKQSMMSFPPVEDLKVEMTPSMPSMGHGSPNNENPVHTLNGHYVGKVNFTMTGDWRIDLEMTRDSKIITETHFDLMLD